MRSHGGKWGRRQVSDNGHIARFRRAAEDIQQGEMGSRDWPFVTPDGDCWSGAGVGPGIQPERKEIGMRERERERETVAEAS